MVITCPNGHTEFEYVTESTVWDVFPVTQLDAENLVVVYNSELRNTDDQRLRDEYLQCALCKAAVELPEDDAAEGDWTYEDEDCYEVMIADQGAS